MCNSLQSKWHAVCSCKTCMSLTFSCNARVRRHAAQNQPEWNPFNSTQMEQHWIAAIHFPSMNWVLEKQSLESSISSSFALLIQFDWTNPRWFKINRPTKGFTRFLNQRRGTLGVMADQWEFKWSYAECFQWQIGRIFVRFQNLNKLLWGTVACLIIRLLGWLGNIESVDLMLPHVYTIFGCKCDMSYRSLCSLYTLCYLRLLCLAGIFVGAHHYGMMSTY